MFKGVYKNYYWIEWQESDKFLKNLLYQFPQIVLGKYLVNTAFNSDSLTLADEEINQGWFKHNELAISPAVTEIENIPAFQYDEWYVFDSPRTFDNYEVFVNYGGFSLQDSAFAEFQARFWEQLECLAPDAYLAEGDHLTYITKDSNLFNIITL